MIPRISIGICTQTRPRKSSGLRAEMDLMSEGIKWRTCKTHLGREGVRGGVTGASGFVLGMSSRAEVRGGADAALNCDVLTAEMNGPRGCAREGAFRNDEGPGSLDALSSDGSASVAESGLSNAPLIPFREMAQSGWSW